MNARNVAESKGQLAAAIQAESLRGKAAGYHTPKFQILGDWDLLSTAELH